MKPIRELDVQDLIDGVRDLLQVDRIHHYLQRARRGYSTSDVYDFDGHLAQIIAGGIREFREENIGHPMDLTPEEWDAILAEIQEGFEIYVAEGGWPVGEGEEENTRKVKRAIKLLRKWFPHLWI